MENIGEDIYFQDEIAFAFNLNKNKIYKILIPEKAIRFKKNQILIGNDGKNNGFWLYDDIIEDFGLLNEPKIYDFQVKNELTDGLHKLTELEIFELNYK